MNLTFCTVNICMNTVDGQLQVDNLDSLRNGGATKSALPALVVVKHLSRQNQHQHQTLPADFAGFCKLFAACVAVQLGQ